MIIGVDVGYGYEKAMAENGESLVGTGFERRLDKLMPSGASEADDYDIIVNGDEPQHYFVGNLAILHSPDATRPFSDNRSSADEIKPVLLTAVARLSKSESCVLVTGLPLEPYLKQAKHLKSSLEKLSGTEVILNGEQTKVVFDRVIMFPQAVAAIYGQLKKNHIGSNGLVGLVDMGYRTIDIILYDVIDMAAKQEKALRNLVILHISRLWRD